MNKKNIFSLFLTLILLSQLSSCGKQSDSQDYIAQDENNDYLISNDNVEKLLDQYSNKSLSTIKQQKCETHITLEEIIQYGHIVKKLGGKIIDPVNFANDLVGFQQFLNESGIKYFSAYEISTPGNLTTAKKCHLKNLLPPQGCWLRSAALTMLAETIRGKIKSPVKMTSHYRSTCYNKSLNGATHSDHLQAKAVDLSYQNKKYREKAINFVCKNFWQEDIFGLAGLENQEELNIQVGIGYTYTHLGIGSKRGKRYWIYKKFLAKNGKLPKSCWSKKLAW